MSTETESFASRHRRAFVGTAVVGLAFAALSIFTARGGAASSADAVSLESARSEFEAGRAVLIDIREPAEHARGVAPGAMLLPMSQLAAHLDRIPADPKQSVLLICNTQNRSKATLAALRERGYAHVRYVEGGMSEWARRGWPLVPPAP